MNSQIIIIDDPYKESNPPNKESLLRLWDKVMNTREDTGALIIYSRLTKEDETKATIKKNQ